MNTNLSEIQTGTLYGVGVGPGDPELLTLKAVRIIQECAFIALPNENKENCVAYKIASEAIPSIENKKFLYISMPMTKDKALLKQKHMEGAKKITDVLNTGASVAFLTLGDPTVYSTFLYVQRLVEEAQYTTQLISGIPSFCAVAAALNHGLVEQSEPLHIYPGSYPIEESLSLAGTKIYMKSGKQIKKVKDILLQNNLDASLVENCGMENEKIYQTLNDIPDENGYYSILVSKSKSK